MSLATYYLEYDHREHTLMLNRKRLNKGMKITNSLPLSPVVLTRPYCRENRYVQVLRSLVPRLFRARIVVVINEMSFEMNFEFEAVYELVVCKWDEMFSFLVTKVTWYFCFSLRENSIRGHESSPPVLRTCFRGEDTIYIVLFWNISFRFKDIHVFVLCNERKG